MSLLLSSAAFVEGTRCTRTSALLVMVCSTSASDIWWACHTLRRKLKSWLKRCRTPFIIYQYCVDSSSPSSSQYEYPGDPDEEGNPTTRPGKLSDPFPNPYPNEEAARFANNGSSLFTNRAASSHGLLSSPGALPPDMSLIVLASNGEEDYIFSLLTGYCDPPAGVEVKEEMAYNPYFAGGALAMPQQLFPDSVEYEDGQ